MNAHIPTRKPKRLSRARRMARHGQSIVEYGLLLSLISILTMGTLRVMVREVYRLMDQMVTLLGGATSSSSTPGPWDPTPTPTIDPSAPPTPTVDPWAQPTATPTPEPTGLCTVPNLSGGTLTYSEAVAIWQNAGFSASNIRAVGGAPKSSQFIVGGQSQPAGAQLSCSRTSITLDYRVCTVPNMVGRTVSDAQTLWVAAGFRYANLYPPPGAAGDSVVIKQSPEATQRNGKPTTDDGCLLNASLETALCTMPNLVGRQFVAGDPNSAAIKAWTDAGFRADRISAVDGAGNSFVVSSQSPATVGSQLDCGASVTVRPTMCTLPNMVGLSYNEAMAAWTNAGFVASNLTVPNGINPSLGFTVESQNPAYAPDTTLACSTGTAQIAPALCTVPDVIGQNFTPTSASWKTIGRPTAFFTSDLVAGAGSVGNFVIRKLTPPAGSTIACNQTVVAEAALCTVPSFEGLTVAEARTLNTGNWRRFEGVQYNGALNIPSGLPDGARVQIQSPAAGERVVCTSAITMQSERLCVVPNLVTNPLSDFTTANTAFRNAGFTTDLLRAANATGNFMVATQSVAAGMTQPCYQSVEVGRACTVPNLVGSQLSVAQQAWANAGFDPARLNLTTTNTQSNFIVMTQNPAANTPLVCGTGETNVTASTIRMTPHNFVNGTTYNQTAAWGLRPGVTVQLTDPANGNNLLGTTSSNPSIRSVLITVSRGGQTVFTRSLTQGLRDDRRRFCIWGDNNSQCNAWPTNGTPPRTTGLYTVTVRATSSTTPQIVVEQSFTFTVQ